MVHVIGIVEGYYDSFEKFFKYFHGKTYNNGKARCRVRILIPVHFGINENGYEKYFHKSKTFNQTLKKLKIQN